jgi:hypothetical protein
MKRSDENKRNESERKYIKFVSNFVFCRVGPEHMLEKGYLLEQMTVREGLTGTRD